MAEPEELKNCYNKQTTFLESELEYVTKLLVDGDNVKYLDYFPNLKSIKIDGLHELYQNQIQSVIDKYPNLENLDIVGQKDLRFLDISSLTKLHELSLVSNSNLEEVIGLDKLDSLYSLSFYDNQSFSNMAIYSLCEQVYDNAYSGVECNIDVLYMPDMLNYIKEKNLDFSMIRDNVTWSEQLKYGISIDHLQYKTGELQAAYEKAQKIVDKYIKPSDTMQQKYAIFYQWMCENVKYDYDASEKNYMNSFDGLLRGRKGGTNGTVNALVYGSCVCQGYTKSMQLLLKLSDIYSSDVGCIAETNKEEQSYSLDGSRIIELSDHSILKVNLDGRILYSDVTWDANRYQKGIDRNYFLLSKKDISGDHKLINEDYVSDDETSISRDEREELLKFASERIKSVNIREERQTTIQELDALFYDGQIDMNTWKSMKKEIIDKYDTKRIANSQSVNGEKEVIKKTEDKKEEYELDKKIDLDNMFRQQEIDSMQRQKIENMKDFSHKKV